MSTNATPTNALLSHAILSHKDIHERLKQLFPDQIGDFVDEKLDPYALVQPAAMARVAAHLKSDPELAFNYLVSVTALDQKETLAAVYHLESMDLSSGRIRHTMVLKSETPRDNPVIASVAKVWATADWQERECWDMMGIKFEGHPNLTRILTDDAWVGHPLRKDYVFPTNFKGIDLT